MYEERFTERHKQGLLKFTGDNAGLLYTNERKEIEYTEEGDREVWVYDVYEVADSRTPALAKNSVIGAEHPDGDEQKIVRKALAKVLKAIGGYDSAEFAEFKRYNEFVEALDVCTIRGSVVADDPTEAELLAAAKAVKINAINEFDASANVNAFTVSGNPMWLNFDLRSRLARSVDTCKEETMTKFFGGVPFTYPVSVWRQMIDAVEEYADKCQTVTEAHKAEVNALTTVAAVEAYDITIGYPPKLNF